MHFLQSAPAETTQYMIAGYTVIFGTMGIYLASMIVRRKNLQRDVQALEKIESKEK